MGNRSRAPGEAAGSLPSRERERVSPKQPSEIKTKMLLPRLVALLVQIRYGTSLNDFPSLVIANASMALVIERAFFETKAVKRRDATRNAYDEKLEALARSVREAAGVPDSSLAMEISVFEETRLNLGRDYTALLSVATCAETWKLYERARKENLVHLAITDPDCPRLPIGRATSVPIVEPGQELAQMLIDLRVEGVLDWSRLNLIHDRVFDRDTIDRAIVALFGDIPHAPRPGLSSGRIFSASSLDSRASAKKILEALGRFSGGRARPSERRYLVVASDAALPTLLRSARSLDMLDPESRWLFVLPEGNATSDFQGLLAEGENVAFIRNATVAGADCRADPERYAREMVGSLAAALRYAHGRELELYEKTSEEEFEALRMSKAERHRLIVGHVREDLNGEGRKRAADCTMWKILAGVTWGNSFGGEAQAHGLIEVGSWTPRGGSATKGPLFPHERYGFGGKALPIVTCDNPPWQYAAVSSGKREWDGLVFDVVNELSARLNFTYKLLEVGSEPREAAAAAAAANKDPLLVQRMRREESARAATSSGRGLPDEITALVRDGKVFMAACATSLAEPLRSSLNFSLPISVQTYGLLASRPKPLSRAILFASPYTPESWACLAGAVLLTGPVLYLVHKSSPSRASETVHAGLSSPARCLWYVYGALLQQGGTRLPENDGARLIVGTWWLVVMVIVATYSGSLVAFLTFPRMEESVSTLDELARRRDTLTWSLPSNSRLVEYLTSGRRGPCDGLLGDEERPAERHDSANLETALERVERGGHVLVDWTSSLAMLARIDSPLTGGSGEGHCRFSIGTDRFLEEPVSLVFPPGSPYLALVDARLKRMKETGLIDKWTRDRMPRRDECWQGSGAKNPVNDHKVDVSDMQGIFFVLFLGYSLALALLAWEFLSRCRSRARERKIIRPFLS